MICDQAKNQSIKHISESQYKRTTDLNNQWYFKYNPSANKII